MSQVIECLFPPEPAKAEPESGPLQAEASENAWKDVEVVQEEEEIESPEGEGKWERVSKYHIRRHRSEKQPAKAEPESKPPQSEPKDEPTQTETFQYSTEEPDIDRILQLKKEASENAWKDVGRGLGDVLSFGRTVVRSAYRAWCGVGWGAGICPARHVVKDAEWGERPEVVAACTIQRGSRGFRGGRSTEAWAAAVPSIDGRGARRNSGQGRGSDVASGTDCPCKRT